MSASEPIKEVIGAHVSAAKQLVNPWTLRRPMETLPLIGIVGAAIVGMCGFGIYSLLTKNDVMLNHHAKIPPWERLDLEHTKPQKLLTYNQRYDEVKPEVARLIKEMNAFDESQK